MAYSVSELNNKIKKLLTTNFNSKISVSGEVTNFKLSGNHTYFSLKDNEASISIVCWNLRYELKNGEHVIVSGKIATYPKLGTYQISASNIDKIGVGKIHEEYEKNKKIYEENGYFNKKRKLSEKIKNIGILTAIDGAAYQDILYVLKSHDFTGKIYVKNTVVQGSNCSKSIVNGIKYFNENIKDLDLILLTRGGGSIEDLIGFSHENVVKAIYESNIITISAVGHEIDFMLSDFAADIRAPTPSIAAQIIVKNNISYKSILLTQKMKYERIITMNENYIERELKNTIKSKIYEILQTHKKEIIGKIDEEKNKLIEIEKKYENIYNIIPCVILTNSKGKIIRNMKDYKKCKKLKIKFSNGEETMIELK